MEPGDGGHMDPLRPRTNHSDCILGVGMRVELHPSIRNHDHHSSRKVGLCPCIEDHLDYRNCLVPQEQVAIHQQQRQGEENTPNVLDVCAGQSSSLEGVEVPCTPTPVHNPNWDVYLWTYSLHLEK